MLWDKLKFVLPELRKWIGNTISNFVYGEIYAQL